MAQTNGGAAYRGYQKLDNGISQGLQHWGRIKAQENAAEKLADERAQVREQNRKDEWMKTHQWQDLENELTNYQDFDDLSRVLYTDVRNQTTDLYRKAIELRNNGNTLEADKTWNMYLKTRGAFEQFAKVQPILKEHNDNFVKAFEEGKVSGVDDDYLSFIQAQANYDVKPKVVNGSLTYEVALKDKDDKIYDVKEFSHFDVVNNKYQYIPKNEMLGDEGVATKILKAIGKREFDEIKGDYKYTFQKWDDKANAVVDSYVESVMENDRTMSDLLFQATGRKKYGNIKYRRRGEQDDFTSKDREDVKNWIKQLVEGGYDTKKEKDVRNMTPSERKRQNALNRNDKGSGSGKGFTYDDVVLENGEKGKIFSTGKGFDFSEEFLSTLAEAGLEKPDIIKRNYNSAIVTENGDVYLTSGSQDEKRLKLDSKQQVYIANKLGFSTAEQLRTMAGVKKDDFNPQIVNSLIPPSSSNKK